MHDWAWTIVRRVYRGTPGVFVRRTWTDITGEWLVEVTDGR